MRWLADALTPFEGAQAFVILAARVRYISCVEPFDLNAKQFSRLKLISERSADWALRQTQRDEEVPPLPQPLLMSQNGWPPRGDPPKQLEVTLCLCLGGECASHKAFPSSCVAGCCFVARRRACLHPIPLSLVRLILPRKNLNKPEKYARPLRFSWGGPSTPGPNRVKIGLCGALWGPVKPNSNGTQLAHQGRRA